MSIIPAKLVCDLCGTDDDFSDKEGPYFPQGMVVKLRADDMSRDSILDLDICVGCRDKLFEAFPKLKALFEEAKKCQ
jgi:hypothetical protein